MTGSTVRAALSAGVKYQQQHHVNICGSIFSNMPKVGFTVSARPCLGVNLLPATRNFSSQDVTKNLRLMTPEDDKPKVDKKSLIVEVRQERPLVVFLEWMAAQKNHVQKFTDLYLGSGYDVLVAPLTPSQLLFPTSGSQVVAAEVARFLANNNHYSRILVHGFSIGGYVWGEVEFLLSRDSSRYSSVIQRIHGQVWDSVVGMESIIRGFPLAIFPRNFLLRTAFSKYLGERVNDICFAGSRSKRAKMTLIQHFLRITECISTSIYTPCFSNMSCIEHCIIQHVPTLWLYTSHPRYDLVAEELIRFLAENPAYKRVVVHGFSVGGYLWGEVCLRMNKHPALPQQVVGQVWDSLVDVVGAGQGVAASMFPRNDVLKRVTWSFIELHLWLFKSVATKHYQASSACFHNPPVNAPALVFASRGDPICSFKEMMGVVDGWREQNMKIRMKIWEDSPHVGHLRKHRKEYIAELNNFLEDLQLPVVHDNEAEKIASKL